MLKYRINNIHNFINENEICKFIIYFKECDKYLSKDTEKQIEKFYQQIKDLYYKLILSVDAK